LVTACGSSRGSPSALVLVAGQRITRADLNAYVGYSRRFYAWVHQARGVGSLGCDPGNGAARCTGLQGQALARLIEEHVVMAYASAHHIQLTAREESRIDQEMNDLRLADAAGGSLLRSLGVTPSFMKEIVRREMLVQRVEDTVAPPAVKVGPAFHLRHFFIFYGVEKSRKQARDEALTLAIAGSPVPDHAGVRVDWVAPFRLPSDIRSQLILARPGQFVGPFPGRRSFLVLQLLARGSHRYGQPARQQLEAQYFRRWLARAVSSADPKCFSDNAAPTPCPIAGRPS
jgi:hypothetical protein